MGLLDVLLKRQILLFQLVGLQSADQAFRFQLVHLLPLLVSYLGKGVYYDTGHYIDDYYVDDEKEEQVEQLPGVVVAARGGLHLQVIPQSPLVPKAPVNGFHKASQEINAVIGIIQILS